MTQGVVDPFEAVQVYKQNRDRLRSFHGILQDIFKLLLEQQAVAETGERVVIGKMQRSRIRFLANRHFRSQLLVQSQQKRGAIGNIFFQAAIRPG